MRNNVNSIWTEDRTDMLRKLFASGSFSCSGMAAELGNGITRNAVIGKMHRLGLTGRIYDRSYPRKTPEQIEVAKRLKAERRNERRRTQRASIVMVKVNLEALRCVEVEPLHKSLADLGRDDCRYPYGEGPYTFCGQPQREGHSYCGGHFALTLRRGWGS
jgi:GcrA cell cycle regulator